MRTTDKQKRGARVLFGGFLLCGALLAGGCSQDEGFDPGEGDQVAVNFTAGIDGTAVSGSAAAPKTRTTSGGDEWVGTDQVGIFMLTTGGTLPGGISSGADNIKHNATPGAPTSGATFAPATAAETLYYPKSGNVDFIAYYPYGAASAGSTTAGTVNSTDYTYNISVSNQSNPAAIDILYSNNAVNIARSKTLPVNLDFEHVMSKITLNLTHGDGLTAGDISGLAATDVVFNGMPVTAELALQNGTLTPSTTLTAFNPLKATASAGVDATFSAILVPQPADHGLTNRAMVFTVNGQPYTWTIPNAEVFAPGNHYTYTVTIKKTGITVGAPTITKWNEKNNGTSTAVELKDFVKIPAGTFQMGNPGTDGDSDEKPQHWVKLTKEFYMSKYQITNAQYAAFLNAKSVQGETLPHPYSDYGNMTGGKCTWGDNTGQHLVYEGLSRCPWGVKWSTDRWIPQPGYENHPVIWVTWYGAMEYAHWVGGTLPTEAQWEYACRAGTTTHYSYGDIVNDDYMWYAGNSEGKTKAVGSRKPNPLGLYDMHGNVYEWCLDQWDGTDNYQTAANEADAITDPLITSGQYRVFRGGGYISSRGYCRSAYRNGKVPNEAFDYIGFRVAVVP